MTERGLSPWTESRLAVEYLNIGRMDELESELANLRRSWGLNINQARFVRLVWGGFSPTEAYCRAYFGGAVSADSAKYQNGASSASRMLKDVKVRKALESLEIREAALMGSSRDVKRGILAAIVMGEIEGTKPADRIRAIIADNRMTGDDRPIRVEGELNFQAMLDSLPQEILPGAYAGCGAHTHSSNLAAD